MTAMQMDFILFYWMEERSMFVQVAVYLLMQPTPTTITFKLRSFPSLLETERVKLVGAEVMF